MNGAVLSWRQAELLAYSRENCAELSYPTVRMFSVAPGADVDALFTNWEGSLNGNGYPVTLGADDLLDRSIEFSGPGIANAKIIVAPTSEDERNIIELT